MRTLLELLWLWLELVCFVLASAWVVASKTAGVWPTIIAAFLAVYVWALAQS